MIIISFLHFLYLKIFFKTRLFQMSFNPFLGLKYGDILVSNGGFCKNIYKNWFIDYKCD